jgi:hydroxyacyl-ACP dehydratase HTD2-like protein with hotdog domain
VARTVYYLQSRSNPEREIVVWDGYAWTMVTSLAKQFKSLEDLPPTIKHPQNATVLPLATQTRRMYGSGQVRVMPVVILEQSQGCTIGRG